MNSHFRTVPRSAALACCALAPLLLAAWGCASDGGSSKAASSGDVSATQASAGGKPVNVACPLMPEHPVPESGATTVVYKGQVVGFCCSDCAEAWTSLSDAEREKALRDAMAAR